MGGISLLAVYPNTIFWLSEHSKPYSEANYNVGKVKVYKYNEHEHSLSKY